MIPNGVQAIEFRSRTVDTNLAMTKGSIYVGTSATSTIGGNTVYAVETINPVNNAVTGWIPNTVQLPIYNGSYGTTGMAFAAAANIVVGRAEALGNASSAYSVGGSTSGSGVGNAVYFSGGVPVALAKVANAVYADSARSATTATTATKLSTSNGNSSTPVYFSGGKPIACTDYANATVGTAKAVSFLWQGDWTGSSSQATKNIKNQGYGLYLATVNILANNLPYSWNIWFTYSSITTYHTIQDVTINGVQQSVSLDCTYGSSGGNITIITSFGNIYKCMFYKMASLNV